MLFNIENLNLITVECFKFLKNTKKYLFQNHKQKSILKVENMILFTTSLNDIKHKIHTHFIIRPTKYKIINL